MHPPPFPQWYEGYLPFDKSGDWFYQACEALSVVQIALLVVAATVVFKRTYSKAADGFGTRRVRGGRVWV